MLNGREKHSNFEGGPGYPRLGTCCLNLYQMGAFTKVMRLRFKLIFPVVAFASWRIGSTLVLWLFFFAFFVLFLKCLRALLRSIADAFQDVFGQLSDSGNQVQQIQPQQQQQAHNSYWRPGNIADRSGQVRVHLRYVMKPCDIGP